MKIVKDVKLAKLAPDLYDVFHFNIFDKMLTIVQKC